MVARQHPGEAMAEWFIEGFLDRLTDPHDGASMRVLEHAVFYVVSWPCCDLSCEVILVFFCMSSCTFCTVIVAVGVLDPPVDPCGGCPGPTR